MGTRINNKVGDMEKGVVVYKRRPKKPAFDIPADCSDVDKESRPLRVSGVEVDVRGTEIFVPEKGRKSWVDRSLSNKGSRRCSLSTGGEIRAQMAYKWVGTLFGRKPKDQKHIDKTLHDQLNKMPTVVSRNKKVNPPIEFLKEKQAMFAEIDSFDLESEEESPGLTNRGKQWSTSDTTTEALFRRCTLDIVQEVGIEEFDDSLSTVLNTPESCCSRDEDHELSFKSSSSPDDEKNVAPRNLFLDSELYSSPTLSFVIEETDLDCRVSNPESISGRSDSRAVSNDDNRRNESTAAVCDSLVFGLENLLIGVKDPIDADGHSLNTLTEEDDDDDEAKGTTDGNFVSQSHETVLEKIKEDPLPLFEALLEACGQTRPLSLREAISNVCDLSAMVKLGEGTFGEAFKGGQWVFKIVPMNGDFLVNGEVQKSSAEIYSEVLLTNTLERLRGANSPDSTKYSDFCTNFIETKDVFICRGSYEVELCHAWEEWNVVRKSENDHPMIFPQNQLYVVFVLADGGTDLESFVLSNFNEVQSVLLQVVLALAIAEESCGFEHRDLHWGNLVIARDDLYKYGRYRFLDEDLEVKTFGVRLSIIDFTLSRINTGSQVLYTNLSADPGLFEGPSGDIQCDTYRRMLGLTMGDWEGSFPQTNCFWIHYVADILLKKKAYVCSPKEKRALRSFCKRVLLYEFAKAAVTDSFFGDTWAKSPK